MPALTETELAGRTEDWMAALFTIVPEHMLEQSFQNAIHEHTGSFPVNGYEVLDAFKRLKANGAEMPAADERKTPAGGSYCERCYNTGFEHVYDLSGKLLGVRVGNQPRCDHREVVQGEGLWYHLERRREKHEAVAGNPIPSQGPLTSNVVDLNQGEQNAR